MLMKHCRQIQKQLVKKEKQQITNNHKAFCRLMLHGRVRKALKYINANEKHADGVHKISEEVVHALKLKHPAPGPKDSSVLLDITSEIPDPVLFEGIDGSRI